MMTTIPIPEANSISPVDSAEESPMIVSSPPIGEVSPKKQLQQISEISTESTHQSEYDIPMTEEVDMIDGSVVSTPNVEKSSNFEESEAQKLLEAEKRRLIAELETGTIFTKKDDVCPTSKSVDIEMVDDTALLDVFPLQKKGKDHTKRPHGDKDAPRKYKKQDKGKLMYSRNQMRSMRYAQMGNQKKLWSDMYGKLLPELAKEYEGLVSLKKASKCTNQKDNGIGSLDDLTLEEEEYVEETDDYTSILRPAFNVEGEPDFDSGPPEDGLEYLRRVRWEARRVPNVIIAKVDENTYVKKEQSVYMPQIPEIAKCPEHLLPVKEWEDSLLSDFSQLRLALSQNADEYEDEMIPSQSVEDMFVEIFSKRIQVERDESFGLVVSEIQGMDSVTRVSNLKKRISLVEKKESGLESGDCKWVVALCASVDTPLDGDTCACLRSLLRKCASLRAVDVEDEQVVVMANMLITITGRYFGQME